MDSYKVLIAGGEGEIIEKKSRFIATVRKCETEDEASAFIEEMKKKYWDASHNCSAFIIGSRAEITRCSDDGEPSGTAGRPMLEVLLGEEIRNIAVVVTRYFGGTLLGTGGLVRAYSQAVKAGLEQSVTGIMVNGAELSITTDYNGIGRVLYILGQKGIAPKESDYGAEVSLTVQVAADSVEELSKELTDATGGKARINKIRELYFIKPEKKEA
jgi:uncharacterized YigZ family protein